METISKFAQLLDATQAIAKAKRPARAAFLGIPDAGFAQALVQASKAGFFKHLLLAPKTTFEKAVADIKVEPSQLPIINNETTADACAMAVKMVNEGQVDFLITGEIGLSDILSGLFSKANDFRNGKQLVSHVAVFEHEKYPRLLFLSDGAVNVAPDLVRKMAIVQNAVGIAQALGVETPKVAVLAAVEVVYPVMDATKDGAVLAKMSDRKQIKGCVIDGPLSMDCAVVPEVARDKGVVSEVAGVADVLIAPNIETGNGIYKAMSLVSKAKSAGVIVGGKCPIAISSRCDGPDNNFHTILLGSYLALQKM